MGCYSGIGVIILLYFVVFVLNIVKTPKQMNCFGVLQRFQAANLGHIRAHIEGSNVPDGFCIPFAYYQAMMVRLGINATTLTQIEMQSDGDNRKRRTALLTLQKKITDAEIPSEWKHRWAE